MLSEEGGVCLVRRGERHLMVQETNLPEAVGMCGMETRPVGVCGMETRPVGVQLTMFLPHTHLLLLLPPAGEEFGGG